ncbi:hypothetical protein HanRHA438_Chr05g0215461 [Helianthus annuus]|uniref:Uncharacterized protein n=1 Tax=Helianthus annuus TaxID=4232 RepID=A0A251UP12_HELAN|nr:hypothetical protein HanHA300_Chr05g0168881 [Helianthus annuus]KAJ0583976.1 hypothetical protein HanHA89_Chr05g0182971 [Helianthus annuus]KAJ0749657.1 hypothetical protein HanLR1_Chr05g0172581 [Helianthus annuus]KAJ0918238.1 hypothetical protein HanRHA438_Chr05g0215461 [Helianthus annuus]
MSGFFKHPFFLPEISRSVFKIQISLIKFSPLSLSLKSPRTTLSTLSLATATQSTTGVTLETWCFD